MLVVCNYATLYECWVTVRMRHLKNVRTSLQDLLLAKHSLIVYNYFINLSKYLIYKI